MTITLREINKDNWYVATGLKVSNEQKNFVAPNWYSVLEALYSEGELYSRGIYKGDEMVGYTMMGQDKDTQQCYIVRLMIDAKHQGKGYGRTAMKLMVDDLKARYNPDAIFISFEPENHAARKLYESLGFADTGKIEEGELVFRLPLTL
jgi:diamine N-acetyltransferase